ncbi:MAG TPA: hypothetical protein VHX65_00130 [Pirellulales bacterium]|nr:hypothetical protein [Pirellulales bacterium]
MKLIFRVIDAADTRASGAGEIYIQPAAGEFQNRCDLASLVLEQGLKCLRHGTGVVDTAIVSAEPTLDDLLAATFVMELLAGRELPPGAASFARYAALVREGHIPSKLPLESSLEGLFLAIRNTDGADLTQQQIATRFAARWEQLSRRILQAAADGLNPFTTPLVAEGSEFAREQAFLARDHEVYKQDVERGQQWEVSIAGGPPRGRAIRLRDPKSLLFKQWSRRAEYCGAHDPFVFLAVDWGNRHWVFSTDPVQRVSIKPLADVLQAAEAKLDADAAARDPWFDGKRFDYTLVAAPHQGTKLGEADLMAIVHDWCDAPRLKRPGFARHQTAVAAVFVCLLVGGGWWFFHRPDSTGSPRGVEPSVAVVAGPGSGATNSLGAASAAGAPRGIEFLTVSDDTVDEKIQQKRTGSDYAIFIATDHYAHWSPLHNAVRDATSIADLSETHYGFSPAHVKRCWDCPKDEVTGALEDYFLGDKFRFGHDDQLLIYIAGHGERVGTKGYLVAADSLSPSKEDSQTRNSYIDLATIKDDVEKIQAKGCRHVLLIMDICFGDMIDFSEATKTRQRGVDAEKLTPERKDKIVQRIMAHPCCMFLTSVGADQPASDGTVHSPFAQYLINLLQESPRDGLITFPDVLRAVRGSTQEPCHGFLQGHENNGDFVFIWQP